MLYVFYGTDSERAKNKANDLVGALLKKKPGASHFSLDPENFSADLLDEYIGGKGLFEGKYIVSLNRTLEEESSRNEVLARISDIADSENIFILFEEIIDAKTATKLSKSADKVQKFATKEDKAGGRFNIFSLTDAFGKRDTKLLWSLYHKAMRSGVAPEEVHGILFWQAKTMLMVAQNDKSGIKPFVVNKSKGFIKNFEDLELEQLTTDLVSVYHRSRAGGLELSLALEKFVLAI